MKLIADSGGSGTTWALIQNGEVTYVDGFGLHPDVITHNIKLPKAIQTHADSIKSIYFYGTGCAKKKKAAIVEKFLSDRFQNASIKVYSDLLALAHPVFQSNNGLVGILGTGSSMCYYDGENIHFKVDSPGKGFDPGSGPVIGQMVIQKIRNKQLSDETEKLFFENDLKETQIDDLLLRNINNVLFQNLSNPECYCIIKDAFFDYFEFYRPLWSTYFYPVAFGGTIAELGKPILENVMKRKGIHLETVVRYPIENLVEYYR